MDTTLSLRSSLKNSTTVFAFNFLAFSITAVEVFSFLASIVTLLALFLAGKVEIRPKNINKCPS